MKRIVLAFALLPCVVSIALAVPGALNYQGQLFLNGSPAAGPVSIAFRMFAAPTGGTELWAETDIVAVTGGLFSTTLGDGTAFPATLFTAQVPWLEMEVSGQVLSPRTRFQSVPYALNAPSSGGSELWDTDGTNVWRGSGNVGVGTSIPNHPVEAHGTQAGQVGFFHSTSPSGTNYGIDAGAQGVGATTNIGGYFYASGATNNYAIIVPPGYGSMGLGTNDPDRKLTVIVPVGVNDIARFRSDNGNCDVVIGAAEGQVASIYTLAGQGLAIGTNNGNGPIRITSAGDVGIGMNSPDRKLTVLAPPGVNDIARFRSDNGNCDVVIGAAEGQVASIYTLAGQGLAIGTNNGNGPIRITSSGYVGIGTNDPQFKLHVIGDLTATGTKCREVNDPKFGKLYYNAIESGEAIFTTSDRARLTNGKCHVEIDPRWLAGVTIDDGHPLNVAITLYGPHGNWYVLPGTTGFDLVDPSGSNSTFFWVVQARQKGYEDIYLNRPGPTAGQVGGKP